MTQLISAVLLQADQNDSMIAFFVILISLVLFIVLRKVLLWYYKLDLISDDLREQTKLLREINKKLTSNNQDDSNEQSA